MKKIILAIVMVASVFTANAQKNLVGSKLTDNWSIGVAGGVYEPLFGQNIIKDARAAVSFNVQKQLTPIFGVGIDYMAAINANNGNSRSFLFWNSNDATPKTAFDFHNLGVNGYVNLNNLFGGYKGKPQLCEVVAHAGMGWFYIMGTCYGVHHDNYQMGTGKYNKLSANFGVDVNFNVCDAWAINLKPAVTYLSGGQVAGLDIRNSYVTLQAGVTYKFKNSNGTHHFVINDKVYSQAQFDEMNAKINAERAAKEQALLAVENGNKKITNLQAELETEKAKEKTTIVTTTTSTTTQLAPVVIYGLGKKTVDASQKPSVAMIATYMKNHPASKVRIQGYASPEGNPELNQKLSEARAQAVYDMLVKQYGISADRLEVKGMGVTDELFDENDWNRVATFIDLTPNTETKTETKTTK